jgi:Yip1 domain
MENQDAGIGPDAEAGEADSREALHPQQERKSSVSRTSPTVGIDRSREHPYLTIWTRPRATIRGIVNTDPTYQVIPLTLVSGILQALSLAASTGKFGRFPVWATLGTAAVLGPILGLVLLYVGAWLVDVSCRMIGGRANLQNVRAALAWSMVPIVATIPLWVVRIVVLGKRTFVAELPSFDASFWQTVLLLLALGFAEFFLQVWSLVILLAALAEVEGLSVWKSLGCLLALVLVAVIAAVIFVAIVLLQ